MESNIEPEKILETSGDRRRRMTSENTKETRENWFKLYDLSEVIRLQQSFPYIPVLLAEPGEEISIQHKSPQNHIVLAVLFFTVGVLVLINLFFLLVGLFISAFSLFVFLRTEESSERNLQKRLLQILAVAYTIFVVLLPVFFNAGDNQAFAGVGHLLLAAVIYFSLIKPWFSERNKVKIHNQRLRVEKIDYERVLSKHKAACKERDEIKERISDLTVSVLHLDEMAKMRRALFNSALDEAFAELNVPRDVQIELLNDRESLVLEITRPYVDENSPYGRPVVQLPLGQIPFSNLDTPILATYLSHLYVIKIALILPQGIGTYEAVIDSVDLTTRLLQHDLTLWRSISRVIRQNASTDWLEDEIVLETYGGSMNRFAVNGAFVNEKLETVPIFRFVGSQDESEEISLNPRVVNAFVRSVQSKISP